MKIAIVYFSLSGRTETLGNLTAELLRSKNCDVSVLKLETEKTGSFFRNCIDAFSQKKARLKTIPDIGEYDIVFLCSPVWAFDVAPAMRSFMEDRDMKGKKVFLMTTYGSGKGKERAMNMFEMLVKEMGGDIIGKADVKGKKVREDFHTIKGGIEECLR
ncbi:MAG TPA: flavodoxin [bacterium]|nr:flavodoxin [bacterium]